jgi:type I restriction enzyme M protein
MNQREIMSKLDALWLDFHSGGITNPITVIEQISYLIFARLLDITETRHEVMARRSGEKFKPIFGPDQQHLRWSDFKDKPGAQLLPLLRDEVFEHFSQVEGYGGFMKGAQLMVQKPELIELAVNVVDKLPLVGGGDTKGNLYEHLLSKLSAAGIAGQFRTPRHIIRAIVGLIDPKPEETVCDPACGTAGFLVESLVYLLKKFTSEEGKIETEDTGVIYTADRLSSAQRKNINNGFLTGFEFDSTMLRISAMNMMLHGVETPSIYYQDTLASSFSENYPEMSENAFHVIMANPPFKGAIDYDRVSSSLVKKVKTKKTELLFVQLILRMLKMGGRGAVIVPDGVLFGSSQAHLALRKTLVDENQLEAIISLPAGVFKPYAGVSTGVLLFAKGGQTKDVFFYDVQNDGYSLDDKRTPIKSNDLPDLQERWAKRNPKKDTNRTAKAFFVPKDEIVKSKYDFSISRYKKEVYEEQEYEEPEVIIEKMEKLEGAILDDLKELKGMLG